MQNSKILIICYSFPTHPGIGGRRWAKFAKYLCNKGFDVTVFNAKNFATIDSLWTRDIDTKKIKVINHEFDFQKLFFFPENILDKVKRKIFLFLTKFTKYTPDIITSFPNKKLWSNVEMIVKQQKIQNVIVTGDPFLFYYASQLKKKIDFNLVLDYRDLWNDHSFYDEFVSMSKKQKVFFENAEDHAVNNCNKIVCVDEGIKNTISKRLKNNTEIVVINNGFDKSDIAGLNFQKKNTDKIRIVFAGSISSDNNRLIEKFVDNFFELKLTNKSLFDKFELFIYSPCDKILQKKFNSFTCQNFIFQNQFQDAHSYFHLINSMHFGVIFISKEYTGSFATKFADYINFGVLTLSLGYSGEFSKFIIDNGIGLHFDIDRPDKNFFEQVLKLHQKDNIIDIKILEQFDVESLTDKVISTLI